MTPLTNGLFPRAPPRTGLLSMYKSTMLDFPKFTPECQGADKKDPLLSAVACSFESQTLGKLISKEAHAPGSAAYAFWRAFEFTKEDYDEALSFHTSGGGIQKSVDAQVSHHPAANRLATSLAVVLHREPHTGEVYTGCGAG